MSTQYSIQKFFRVYMPTVAYDDMVTVKSVSSGNVWRMEMTTNDESNTVFIREGWKKVVRDENLKEPTFLVFEFDGSCVFHFFVYDHRSMCKRVRFPIEKEVIQVESEEEEEESNKTDEDDDDDERDEETDDDDDDDDDDDMIVENEEITEGLDESPKRKERGGTSRRGSSLKTNRYKRDEYLDNKLNPTFPIDTTKQRTRIPAALINDYNLTFPKMVIVRDNL